MPAPPPPPAAPALPASGLLGGLALAAVAAATALQPLPPAPAVRAERAGPAGCAVSPPGFLAGRLYGDVDLALDWRGSRLRCDGMLRDDDGLRLMFAGPVDGATGELVLVVGIGGTLAGIEGAERPANVTLIDQRTGRFYAARGPGRCWTTVLAADPLPAGGYRLTGTLDCAGALPALQDAGSVTLGDVRYAGRLAVE
jgi:hypothetical protein